MTDQVFTRLKGYWSRLPSWAWIAVGLAVYLLTLCVWLDRVPAGLNNDAAEEALRGVYLLERHQIEVINLHGVHPDGEAFGRSMETLFLYVLAIVARFLGTTTLAIHVSTWLFALASIWLLCRLTQRIDPALPTWLPLLLAFSSVWLYHYARSGLRANTAPVFLLGFTLLLDRTERFGPRWGSGLACGAILGLSLYGYTSCRVLPIAFAIHALGRLWCVGRERRDLLYRYAFVSAGALLVSIPNILFLVREPWLFLLRGAYATIGMGRGVELFNILKNFLLPFYYPHYRMVVGPTHTVDGVSLGLTVAGIRPLHPIVGLAFLVGLAQLWRRRREPMVSFLLCAWLTGTVALGLSGPSLTRMLLLLPFYLVAGALGFGAVFRFRGTRSAVGALLLLVAAGEARSYFVTFAQSPSSRREYSQVATSMGQRSRILAAEGTRVMCLVAENANVVRYLTHDFHEGVQVHEFWRRPANINEIPLMQFRPQVILVERGPGFELLRAVLLAIAAPIPRRDFDEFRVYPGA